VTEMARPDFMHSPESAHSVATGNPSHPLPALLRLNFDLSLKASFPTFLI